MAVLNIILFFLLLAFSTPPVAYSGDPDILSDFVVPPNATVVDGNLFTFTGMRPFVNDDLPLPRAFAVAKASTGEFPALGGQSVSFAVLQFPSGSVNPPHAHPRSAELLFLLGGSLEVGFVDTAGKLYTQTLHGGDMFVFPKGLVHFQFNSNREGGGGGGGFALAMSAFGSANAGTVSLPGAVFADGVDEAVLAESFKTDVATIRKIKLGLATKQA